jgi:hypothetical protein
MLLVFTQCSFLRFGMLLSATHTDIKCSTLLRLVPVSSIRLRAC